MTPINIHPLAIYINNVILICMSTFQHAHHMLILHVHLHLRQMFLVTVHALIVSHFKCIINILILNFTFDPEVYSLSTLLIRICEKILDTSCKTLAPSGICEHHPSWSKKKFEYKSTQNSLHSSSAGKFTSLKLYLVTFSFFFFLFHLINDFWIPVLMNLKAMISFDTAVFFLLFSLYHSHSLSLLDCCTGLWHHDRVPFDKAPFQPGT